MFSRRILLAVVLLTVHYASAGSAAEQTIIVVGDSLSSGYGLPQEQSWVSMLQERLGEEGYGYRVVNASVSGDTSAGGLARLPSILAAHDPSIVIIELGGNDGLRGQPIQGLRSNLASMIELVQTDGGKPLLAGIKIPPNYGESYTRAFGAVYPELASEYGVALVEFLLDGVALDPDLMQNDVIHPNADGHQIMLDNVWPVLKKLL
jgi:acyl-CoA thioesterase-1